MYCPFVNQNSTMNHIKPYVTHMIVVLSLNQFQILVASCCLCIYLNCYLISTPVFYSILFTSIDCVPKV